MIEILFLIYMGTQVVGILVFPITWLLLSIFTPHSLLTRYFKEPHFSTTETYMMSQFPGFLMRTAIFGWTIFFPKLGKKRQIQNLTNYMPAWYKFSLIFLNIFVAVIALITLFLTPILLLI